ncbi:MAG: HAMP domain-containing protein [Phycisphaerae bacterium]
MLRRKLLTILGLVVLLLAAMTVVTMAMLHRLEADMQHVVRHATELATRVARLGQTVTEVELRLHELESGRVRHLDPLIEGVETLNRLVEQIGTHYIVQREGAAKYARLRGLLPRFRRHVGALATTRDPDLAAFHTSNARDISVTLRQEAVALGALARRHAAEERANLISRFRWILLGLAVVFLLVINVAVLMLWRAASMVLRPVERLVEASRELARGRFDHRVRLKQKDEFDELGAAYNRLAEQLQTQEQRRMEMLVQVARALNHELNNALSIIEMQLNLLEKRAGDPERTERCLRQIRESLTRMTEAVQSLKRVRRFVLTDYTDGEKMLDIQRSIQAEEGEAAPGEAGPGREDAP